MKKMESKQSQTYRLVSDKEFWQHIQDFTQANQSADFPKALANKRLQHANRIWWVCNIAFHVSHIYQDRVEGQVQFYFLTTGRTLILVCGFSTTVPKTQEEEGDGRLAMSTESVKNLMDEVRKQFLQEA